MNIYELNDTYYQCIKCGAIGLHNYHYENPGPLNDNDWAEFSHSLTCDKCGNNEQLNGWIDGFGTFETDYWELFQEAEEPSELRSKSEQLQSSAEIIEKGKLGEDAFNSWLQFNGVSFLYVEQSQETFSNLFKDCLKRPDFLILLESIGMIAVDVKNYKSYNDFYSLNLESELVKSLSFERLFRMPLWYAYKTEDKGKWLWISALKALEVGTIRINSETKEQFIMINKSEFALVSSNDDLGKLYTQRVKNPVNMKYFQGL